MLESPMFVSRQVLMLVIAKKIMTSWVAYVVLGVTALKCAVCDICPATKSLESLYPVAVGYPS